MPRRRRRQPDEWGCRETCSGSATGTAHPAPSNLRDSFVPMIAGTPAARLVRSAGSERTDIQGEFRFRFLPLVWHKSQLELIEQRQAAHCICNVGPRAPNRSHMRPKVPVSVRVACSSSSTCFGMASGAPRYARDSAPVLPCRRSGRVHMRRCRDRIEGVESRQRVALVQKWSRH